MLPVKQFTKLPTNLFTFKLYTLNGFSQQIIRSSSLRSTTLVPLRFYTSSPINSNSTSTTTPIPPSMGKFREAPDVIGLKEPPVVDKNSWLQRKKQKLRDFTDYEKAFAAHAAERKHL